MQKTKLDCLYYPFSRLLEPTILKHLLLIFDSVTFLDEAESPEWRRMLLNRMRSESPMFETYEELADDYAMLEENGTILFKNPRTLTSNESKSVAIATIADLTDQEFVRLASTPQRFNLPSRLMPSPDPLPTWQVFEGKLAAPLRTDPVFAHDDTWRSNIIYEGNEASSWSLTYAAGSASVLNYYFEAAEELNLTPVTSSELHHRLILRKVKRMAESGHDQSSLESDIRHRCGTVLGQGEILSLFDELFPSESLKNLSFSDIIRFREETHEQRHGFLERVNSTLRVIDADVSTASYDREVITAIQDMGIRFRRIQQDLATIRDRLLPTVGGAVMYGSAGSGALGALATFLGGLSPAGLIAASSLAAGGALLTQASKSWAERRSTLRAQDSGISYLLSASRLAAKK